MYIISNEFMRSIIRALILLLLLFLCDLVIGSVLRKLYFKQESGDGHLITCAIDSTHAEILILGSSRAKHSYVPAVFSDSLQMSCFNAGHDGTDHILFSYAQFKAINSRYNPEIVILDIRPEDLIFNANEYDMLSPLMPYYKSHKEISEIIGQKSPFEKMKHCSEIYPFNSLIFQIIMGNIELNKVRKPHENGYIPFYGSKVGSTPDTLQAPVGAIGTEKIAFLKDMMHICNEKSIRLVLIYSPTYDIVVSNDHYKVIDALCDENNIKFLNLSNEAEILNNPKYFFDRTHLNDEGARRFSEMVTMELKSLYDL